jgi:hypothetical protein
LGEPGLKECAVIRPFGLRDMLAVRKLQRSGVWLDLFHYLLLRRSALTTAFIAPVPWVGTGVASYVCEVDGNIQGFIQLLRRAGRHEADVVFLAPDIDLHATTTWTELLTYCIQDAGQHDIRRLFASLPVDSAAIDVMAALGFASYAHEDVFELSRPTPGAAPQDGVVMRPRQPDDVWWLRRLYSIYTPLPVQHSEGLSDGAGATELPLAWWELTHQQSYVLYDGDDICGGVQLISGRGGHWLLLHGDPGNGKQMAALVQQGLQAADGRRRVYSAVRDYQGGLRATLQDAGFQPVARRRRLVKHLVVRVRAADPIPVAGMAVERPG